MSRRVPQHRLHKPSGRAVVTIHGRDHYLGPHGSVASRHEYDRLISEWLSNGRQPFRHGSDEELTIVGVGAGCGLETMTSTRSVPEPGEPPALAANSSSWAGAS